MIQCTAGVLGTSGELTRVSPVQTTIRMGRLRAIPTINTRQVSSETRATPRPRLARHRDSTRACCRYAHGLQACACCRRLTTALRTSTGRPARFCRTANRLRAHQPGSRQRHRPTTRRRRYADDKWSAPGLPSPALPHYPRKRPSDCLCLFGVFPEPLARHWSLDLEDGNVQQLKKRTAGS